MKPFLKWVGGKRWLTQRYPDLFEIPHERYLEPFLGGGAVFFHMRPAKAVLSDLNPHLINLYRCVRDDPQKIEELLRVHSRLHSDDYYYKMRGKQFRSDYCRAAQFLYLNRTCWNGLYRQNAKGEFNVPRGTKDTVIFDDDDFEQASLALAGASLCSLDFESVIEQASEGDFVFIDPPYTVKHNMNGFIRYNESLFSWKDQQRLAAVLMRKADCGASFLVTNAMHASIIELYGRFATIISAERASVLSGDSKFRGRTKEALILIGREWESRTLRISSARLSL